MKRLVENTVIAEYKVVYFIKDGLYNSTYRVTDGNGTPFFMKFYDMELVPGSLVKNGDIYEIIYSRKLKHENVISYISDGSLDIEGKQYKYLITDYFNGTLLSEVLDAGTKFSEETSKQIIFSILDGLNYLHSGFNLSHNDLTPRNIILDKIGNDIFIPRIIDLGHISEPIAGNPPFPVGDLTTCYCAPETFSGVYTPKSDCFSIVAILYRMLSGKEPWPCDIREEDKFSEKKAKAREARKRELDIQCLIDAGVTDEMINTIKIGLSFNDNDRPSATELINAIKGKTPLRESPKKKDEDPHKKTITPSEESEQESIGIQIEKKKGNGFDDIAGMEALKASLTNRVIWILKDKEKAEKYNLTPPNGMILYGPPGCGKTYFAEKFAEEAGFNFSMISGSDLGSTFIHGTQGKIAKLFKEAEKKAPVILCFDEFDAFVPARSSMAAQHRPDEVNEFLTQLNNCSKKGIFVIGTTNRLDMIDPAVLRTGRMDLHVEIPAPDAITRALIIKMHLRNRPFAEDINFEELASLTENYAASDLTFIVNEAAMTAALADEVISNTHLLNSIKNCKSSLSAYSSRRQIGY